MPKIDLEDLREGDEIEMKGIADPRYNHPVTIRRRKGVIVIYVPDEPDDGASGGGDVDAKKLIEWLKENTDLIG